jgi:antitoxin component of MazEF toxin-antitoxin module
VCSHYADLLNELANKQRKISYPSQEAIMTKIRLEQHRQLTLPAEIIEQAHLQYGDVLEVSYSNGVLMLTPIKPRPKTLPIKSLMEYAGSCKGAWGNTPEEVEANLAEDRAAWDR